MEIAILALQGAFAEHQNALRRLGTSSFLIRQKRDLDRSFDGLILPGGESTVMGKLLHDLGLFDPLLEKIRGGLPVFGTCAGLLLLARQVAGGNVIFGTLDATAQRNAYGRQLGSFRAVGAFGPHSNVAMPFIRAPHFQSVGPKVEVLSQVEGKIVAARQGNQLATAFHPELTDQGIVHSYFLDLVRTATKKRTSMAL